MSQAFYMDQHVKAAITKGLRRREIDVLTVQEDGHSEADDPVILDRAKQLGRIVFTSDDDFLSEAVNRQRANIPFASVAYVHQKKIIVSACIDDLVCISDTTSPEEAINQIWYLPL